MKFCWKCGTQLNDDDRFCRKCGAESVVPNGASAAQSAAPVAQAPVSQAPIVSVVPPSSMATMQQQYLDGPFQSATSFTVPQRPPQGKALLFVTCNGSSSNPSVVILDNNKVVPNRFAKPGLNRQLIYHPGSILIKYRVDRGPGLTFVSARYTTYSKSLIFHPDEIITMQVDVGRNVTHIVFQSSQGYAIP